jgi:hypothetical protein
MKRLGILVLSIGLVMSLAIVSGCCGSCGGCGSCAYAIAAYPCPNACDYGFTPPSADYSYRSGCGTCATPRYQDCSPCQTSYSCATPCQTSSVCATPCELPPPPQLCLTVMSPIEQKICNTMPLKFVVKNTGCNNACNVMVSADLPCGWTAPGGNNKLCFSAGTLKPGQTKEFCATVRADTPGFYTAEAVATADGGTWTNAVTGTNIITSCR